MAMAIIKRLKRKNAGWLSTILDDFKSSSLYKLPYLVIIWGVDSLFQFLMRYLARMIGIKVMANKKIMQANE